MKAILVIEMPKNCFKCLGFKTSDYYQYCSIVSKTVGNYKPSWCPLKPMPQKKEDLHYPCNEYIQALNEGWNACLEALEDSQKWEDSNE